MAQRTLVIVVNCSCTLIGYTAWANRGLPEAATGTQEKVSAIEGL